MVYSRETGLSSFWDIGDEDQEGRGKELNPVSREYTIHLHKYVHGVAFKKKAPRAMDTIRKFAQKTMKTKDVRLDTKVNQYVWSQGIRHVPRRIRIRVQRKRNEDEDAKEKMYTLVSLVPVSDFSFLQTEDVKEQ
eukprot:TRINITY_DN15680_c0_g1_i1.p1 TRINITY_DN15680_c0_g1~~TRINITY_DN15680_c0_g1_i1.p1  ORF type:complete len:135 (+),score=33.48 TRINITY_DN15680_c0_g1_i1:335-739(+)